MVSLSMHGRWGQKYAYYFFLERDFTRLVHDECMSSGKETICHDGKYYRRILIYDTENLCTPSYVEHGSHIPSW